MDKWKKIVAGLVAMAAAVVYATHGHSAAPVQKGQAPGYYRMMLGDFEVTALLDGTLDLDVKKILVNVKPERVDALLKRAFMTNPVETSVNAYLINTGSKLVLIDTGAGKLFGPSAGNLLTSLKAAGYTPEQVDEIYITHMHGDHVGGLMQGDQRAFPNAIVRADKRDADFWLSKERLAAMPAMKDAFEGAMSSINPYAAAGKFQPFDGRGVLTPGITAVPTYGHTPGHTVYMVESKDKKMAVLGDLMHVASVQFPEPSVTIQFDSDLKAAAEQRKKLYAEGAKQGLLLAVAHIAFPGMGYIRPDGTGYVFYPVNYSIPR